MSAEPIRVESDDFYRGFAAGQAQMKEQTAALVFDEANTEMRNGNREASAYLRKAASLIKALPSPTWSDLVREEIEYRLPLVRDLMELENRDSAASARFRVFMEAYHSGVNNWEDNSLGFRHPHERGVYEVLRCVALGAPHPTEEGRHG